MELSQWLKPFLVFCLIPLVQAYTTFPTNCSAPNTVFNYVASPNTRGTLDILWSSLFTIFACTWTLQHPNVPQQRDGRDPGILGDFKWGLKGFYKGTLRMLLTITAPEATILMASDELFEARRDHKRMQEYVRDGIPWSLGHTYFANMGGFVIRSKSTSETKKYHDPYHLDCRGIKTLLRRADIAQLPDMPEEEIKDKSKGDSFVKAIAMGQIMWSIIQIAVRAVRRLAVSPLEAAVVAFAVCAAVIYGLYWNKPQRIGVAQTILQYDGEIPDDLLQELKPFENFSWNDLPGAPISLDSSMGVEREMMPSMYAIGAIGAALFGGIHAVAWNFAFPSRAELILWRCAAISTAVAPICILALGVGIVATEESERFKVLSNRFKKAVAVMLLIAFAIVIIIYVVSRLFIIVEMFRTLCFLPPGSYVSTWTSNIPHLA